MSKTSKYLVSSLLLICGTFIISQDPGYAMGNLTAAQVSSLESSITSDVNAYTSYLNTTHYTNLQGSIPYLNKAESDLASFVQLYSNNSTLMAFYTQEQGTIGLDVAEQVEVAISTWKVTPNNTNYIQVGYWLGRFNPYINVYTLGQTYTGERAEFAQDLTGAVDTAIFNFASGSGTSATVTSAISNLAPYDDAKTLIPQEVLKIAAQADGAIMAYANSSVNSPSIIGIVVIPANLILKATAQGWVNLLASYNSVKSAIGTGGVYTYENHKLNAYILKFTADAAIATYEQKGDITSLSQAEAAISAVQSYNDILNSNGVGLYISERSGLEQYLAAQADASIKYYLNEPYNADSDGLQKAQAAVALLAPFNDIKRTPGVGIYTEETQALTAAERLVAATAAMAKAQSDMANFTNNPTIALLNQAEASLNNVKQYFDVISTQAYNSLRNDIVLGEAGASSSLFKETNVLISQVVTNSVINNAAVTQALVWINRLSPYNDIQVDGVGAYTAAFNNLITTIESTAKAAIATYQATPNSANLAAAISAVRTLSSYNSIINSLSNLGVYDEMVNNLLQAVKSASVGNYTSNTFSQPSSADSNFSQSVVLDMNYVYVSDPTKGVIYQFTKNSTNPPVIIAPQVFGKGDLFGSSFGVNGNLLAASYLPSGGSPELIVFSNVNGKWQELVPLIYTNYSSASFMKVAVTPNAVVVGLTGKGVGHYMIYNWANGALLMPPAQDAQVCDWGCTNLAQQINSVSASGNYIGIGYETPQGQYAVRILQGVQGASTMSWNVDNTVSGATGFGQSLAIYHDALNSKVTVAVGSPLENSNGAVYTMTKIMNANKVMTWSNLQAANLFFPVNNRVRTVALLDANTLAVGVDNISLSVLQSVVITVVTVIINPVLTNPVMDMVYTLGGNNQWALSSVIGLPTISINSITGNNLSIAYGQFGVTTTPTSPAQVTVVSPVGMCDEESLDVANPIYDNANNHVYTIFPSTFKGQSVVAQCQGGWVGNPTRTCNNGTWGALWPATQADVNNLPCVP